MAQKYKNNSNSAKLDQFYTNPKVAKVIVDGVIKKIPYKNRRIFIEPSAGSGSFSDLIIKAKKKNIAFDLDPKKEYIIKKDFFTVSMDDIGDFNPSDICVIGNPPFGKNSSLAVRFFNHCATLCGTICFIVPRTFKKQSIKNRLNLNFHLVKSVDLPKNSFIFEDKPYDVPCVFQIWQWSEKKRKIVKSKNECALFKFVKKQDADFGVRRAGGRAGTAFKDIENLSEASNHFCKSNEVMSTDEIINLINNINFNVIDSTAGVRSLSKGELIRAVERFLKNV